tara:strand:- start:11559 stop:11675 length:117 start_codon:yes stop_codon:yes gene_type:complete
MAENMKDILYREMVKAILTVGLVNFKKTSLFLSNQKNK